MCGTVMPSVHSTQFLDSLPSKVLYSHKPLHCSKLLHCYIIFNPLPHSQTQNNFHKEGKKKKFGNDAVELKTHFLCKYKTSLNEFCMNIWGIQQLWHIKAEREREENSSDE